MPWCTKCNIEYVDSISVCPNCGEVLVDNLEIIHDMEVLYIGEAEECCKLIDFLKYSHLVSPKLGEEMEDGICVLISKEEAKDAHKLSLIFFQEMDKEMGEKSSSSEPLSHSAQSNTPSSHYRKKSEKYEDLKSSAFTLLLIGTVGIVFILLNAFGILPIKFQLSNFMFYGVLSLMFFAFIVFGIFTLRNAKKIKGEVEEETIFIRQITDWFLSSYTAEFIDDHSLTKMDNLEEVKYFKRTDYIKKELMFKFPNLDDVFLEDIVDVFYQKLYEE